MFFDELKYEKNTLPFKDEEIIQWDRKILKYEAALLNPDVEKNLISQNEFWASFGISKAEDSTLTVTEAKDVYQILEHDKSFDFIAQKMKSKTVLTKKDYEKLEFINIVRTFKTANREVLPLKALQPDFIRELHANLTAGMDVFQKYLMEFTPYKSGKFRDNDLIRVDTYVPPPHSQISGLIKSLIERFSGDPGITATFAFHTLLYAVHPFNNGNKRVCRILEHIMLRMVGMNARNLYSPSYYYHLEKSRYYKYLLAALARQNANYFITFCQEAVVSSQILVLKKGLELKREGFLKRYDLSKQDELILNPLIHKKEVQFKNLYDKKTAKKMARQTFVNALNGTVEQGIVLRREAGRNVFYRLNMNAPEEETLAQWIALVRERLDYVSDLVKMV